MEAGLGTEVKRSDRERKPACFVPLLTLYNNLLGVSTVLFCFVFSSSPHFELGKITPFYYIKVGGIPSGNTLIKTI